jgi:pSer/pThr/pTyr-binding forkhead associated (FHA) protein
MTSIPQIIVQLVHIEGPKKGEIQELSDAEIVIGRHPDCQVQFPKDVVTLSRIHARIVREGNRFKIIDQSTNGTFVNGKQVPEAYLKDGDVITFSEGGPKVSFLTQVVDQPASGPMPAAAPIGQEQYPSAEQPHLASPQAALPRAPQQPPASIRQPVTPQQPMPSRPASPPPGDSGPVIQTVQMPFAIQYGPALKSFQSLPITIGKGSRCDFVINHPAMNEQQVQFFFAQERYWIKDLTGANNVLINGMPIQTQAPLEPNMQLAFSPQGPKFRFLGGGRLAEIEDPLPAQNPSPAPEPTPPKPDIKPTAPGPKPGGSLFKKFFR